MKKLNKSAVAITAGVMAGLLMIAAIGSHKGASKELRKQEDLATKPLVNAQKALIKAEQKEKEQLDKFLKWG